MTRKFTVACIQNSAGTDLKENLDEVQSLIEETHRRGAELICLPEFFSYLEVVGPVFHVGAFSEDRHPALTSLSKAARDTRTWILLGSIAVIVEDGKIVNRSLLLDADGKVVARYDKIHLFDIELEDGESYRESATIHPGERSVVAHTPWGGIGLSVCYDIRFPHLYRSLAKAGAHFLAVPAAFARNTGEAHWHVLLRSRAIETGCYVIAPCQTGIHGESESFGHSLIVDPWGKVLADAGTDVGVIMAEIDPAAVAKTRAMIPSLKHDRPYLEPGVDIQQPQGEDRESNGRLESISMR
jgi:predicted amidohydrolase